MSLRSPRNWSHSIWVLNVGFHDHILPERYRRPQSVAPRVRTTFTRIGCGVGRAHRMWETAAQAYETHHRSSTDWGNPRPKHPPDERGAWRISRQTRSRGNVRRRDTMPAYRPTIPYAVRYCGRNKEDNKLLLLPLKKPQVSEDCPTSCTLTTIILTRQTKSPYWSSTTAISTDN